MKKGFTLVELLATITILGIIALLLIPTVTGVISSFKSDASEDQKKTIISAAKLWISDNRLKAPTTEGTVFCVQIAELKKGYLDDDLRDPKTKQKIPDTAGVRVTMKNNTLVYTYVGSC